MSLFPSVQALVLSPLISQPIIVVSSIFVCIISCCCSHCFRGQSLLFTFRRGQCCCPLSCRPVAGVLQIGYCHRHHDPHTYPYSKLLQLLPRPPRPRTQRHDLYLYSRLLQLPTRRPRTRRLQLGSVQSRARPGPDPRFIARNFDRQRYPAESLRN